MNSNSLFFHEQSICGTRYKTIIFLNFTIWIFLRSDATCTLFLVRVINDLISGSPNMITSFSK